MTREEIVRLEKFLRRTFKNEALQVRQRPKKQDSAEVFVGEEFIGVLFRDDEDGEDDVSYQFQMAILGIDLEDA